MRYFVLTMCLVLCWSLGSGVRAETINTPRFADVPPEDPGFEAVHMLRLAGVIEGKEDGLYYPNDIVTRAEMLVMVDRAFEFYDGQCEIGFTDVREEDWFYSAVCDADYSDVIGGYADGTFRPNDPVASRDFMKVAVATSSEDFSDDVLSTDGSPGWFDTYRNYIYRHGFFVDGIEEEALLTRRDAARFLYQMHLGSNLPSEIRLTDLDADACHLYFYQKEEINDKKRIFFDRFLDKEALQFRSRASQPESLDALSIRRVLDIQTSEDYEAHSLAILEESEKA